MSFISFYYVFFIEYYVVINNKIKKNNNNFSQLNPIELLFYNTFINFILLNKNPTINTINFILKNKNKHKYILLFLFILINNFSKKIHGIRKITTRRRRPRTWLRLLGNSSLSYSRLLYSRIPYHWKKKSKIY